MSTQCNYEIKITWQLREICQKFPSRQGNLWKISLSPKLTNFCKILDFFCPYWRMQNTKIREENLVKINTVNFLVFVISAIRGFVLRLRILKMVDWCLWPTKRVPHARSESLGLHCRTYSLTLLSKQYSGALRRFIKFELLNSASWLEAAWKN